MLDALPGEKTAYSSWGAQVDGLTRLLRGCRRMAMQYSPQCAIPYVAMVDAGTVELVRGLGAEVVSSADLIQYFEARWDEAKLASHLEAGRRVDGIRARGISAGRRPDSPGRAPHGVGGDAVHPVAVRGERVGHRSRPHCGRERKRGQSAL